MAANANARPNKLFRRDAIMDWLQMISGALLVLFMWCHMLLVSSVIISPKVMNAIAWFFEATHMAQVGGPLIFLVILFHFIMAARKMPFTADNQKTIFTHALNLRHRDTWLWLVQCLTAMFILIMAGIHMWTVLSDLPITAAKSAARVQQGGWTAFYFVLLPMAELHISIGFYRILVKWGIIKSDTKQAAKKGELILFSILMLIGILTLIRFLLLK